jgi:AraC-like DNA-binding protein
MSRTRVTSIEAERGYHQWARRAADPRLRPLLAREYVGVRQEVVSATRWSQPPVALVSLIVTLEGPVTVDGEALPGAWLGGLGGVCEAVTLASSHASLDLKLHPLGAYALCGRSLRELDGGCIELADLWGPEGRRLEERLHGAGGWDARIDVLEGFLLRRATGAPSPHPLVMAAWSRLRESGGTVRIGALARELTCSRRHLTALFHEQVGLGPKAASRLLRFQRVCERIQVSPGRWADLAYHHGYSDQAHLNRDFRELADTTPSAFVAAAAASHQVTFLQDGGSDRT